MKQALLSSRLAVVQTTVANHTDAKRMGTALLQQGLAACVQYEAITSQYGWQGEIVCDEEVRISIKTAPHLFAPLEAAILALHDYDCPQIVMLPVVALHQPYADWAQAALLSQPPA